MAGSILTEQFALAVDGLTIAGEVFYAPDSQILHPALCLCHGIPSPTPGPPNLGYPQLARRFALEGFITCIFNFRGTGQSSGNLDLLGWTHDLDAIVAKMVENPSVDKSRIILMGFSAGAAISIFVAAHDQRISALASCASPAEFSSLRLDELLEQCRSLGTIRDEFFSFSPEEWRNHFLEINPIRWIDKVSPRPLLIIHGESDELIELSHAKRLYEKADDPKQLVVIPGAGHQLRTNDSAINTALAWLKALC
jgi:uncharacterized protein